MTKDIEKPLLERRILEWIKEAKKNFKRLERKINYRMDNNRKMEPELLQELRENYRVLNLLNNVLQGKSKLVGRPRYN